MQALKRIDHFLGRSSTSRSDKAVHLCWLFHLVGDIHQPLHSSALFSVHLFPDGDRGGNAIDTQKGNLHSVWDRSLGQTKVLSRLSSKVSTYLADNSIKALGDQAALGLSHNTWLDESRDLADEFAYDEIKDAVLTAESQNTGLDEIQLSDDYVSEMKEIGIERIVQAGFRLAGVLKVKFP